MAFRSHCRAALQRLVCAGVGVLCLSLLPSPGLAKKKTARAHPARIDPTPESLPAVVEPAIVETVVPPVAPVVSAAPLPKITLAVTPLPEPPSTGLPILSIVLAGSGLITAGAGALLISWGAKDNELLHQCAPLCRPSSVDHVRNVYLAGDAAVSVGLVALGGSILVYLLSGSDAAAPGTF